MGEKVLTCERKTQKTAGADMRRIQTGLYVLAVVVMTWSGGMVHAQSDDGSGIAQLRRVKMTKVDTPEYKLNSNISGFANAKNDSWIQLSVAYRTAPKWLDELVFDYYVLMEPSNSKVKYRLLSGSVVNINIAKGNQHTSVMYLHPSTVKRYGTPKKVAVVMRGAYQGRPFELATEDNAWWKKLPAERGMVLNRRETPFAMLNTAAYEALKPSGEGR